MANPKASSVWGVNELGELVVSPGTGSTNVLGYLSENDVPVDEQGRIVIAGMGNVKAVVNAQGVVTGIVGPDGKVIAIGGGNTDTTSPHYPAARAVMRIASVSQIRLITANSSNSFSPRVAHAEKNRKRVTFKNPATNTVSFQLGLTQNDNSNRNQSFTTSYTIAPGEELVCWYDENQWYARQTSATAVANQYLIVETEVNV